MVPRKRNVGDGGRGGGGSVSGATRGARSLRRLRASLRSWAGRLSTRQIVAWACVARLCLVVLGIFQDAHAEVPYTDIDYQVYSDAAQYVCEGESPYARSTYRYTPLLAWLLTPNCLFPSYGKVLFAVCDIMAAMLMIREREGPMIGVDNGNDNLAILIWLFSPFTATISTRGSGESLVVCMLMGMVVLLKRQRVVWAAVLYGFAVHWRIFPIIFAPSILLYLSWASQQTGSSDGVTGGREGRGRCASVLRAYVSTNGVLFGVVSAGVFFGLGAAMHGMYGKEFLDETYLYHLTRVDPRHNFSFYFYPAYLHMHGDGLGDSGGFERDVLSAGFSLAGLVVQAVVADRMMRRHAAKDLAMAFLAQSVAFVAFNKVSTAQYFVWYLCWFCIRVEQAVAKVDVRWVLAWPTALGFWLFWAYLLEFRGLEVHLYLWIAGLIWFWVNVELLRGLID